MCGFKYSLIEILLINQNSFRSIILANYNERCAISGLSVPQLLVASHIVPWSDDVTNRLNPANGICLSPLYDQAFDKGYISIRPDDYTVMISNELRGYKRCDFYQGFFLAPHVVAQALKGALLIGQCMSELGYENYPSVDRLPPDLTRAVRFDTQKQLTDFIQSVQEVSPVDSYVRLEAWDMPGYDCKVIMAAGTFNAGASIELSADAPIREPYVAYFQGGLTYEHCRIAVREILKKLVP